MTYRPVCMHSGSAGPPWKRPDQISRPGENKNLWVIPAEEIEQYTARAGALVGSMRQVAGKLDRARREMEAEKA